MYTMYDWEVIADAMEDVAEWEAHEADMLTMEIESPTDEKMEEMASYYGEN